MKHSYAQGKYICFLHAFMCIIFDYGKKKNPVSALAAHLKWIGHIDHINSKALNAYSSTCPKC